MNLAEANAFRVLKALVESQGKQIAELTRRVDDLSNAERARTEAEAGRETLRLKKSG